LKRKRRGNSGGEGIKGEDNRNKTDERKKKRGWRRIMRRGDEMLGENRDNKKKDMEKKEGNNEEE
jgi:hypothetical protein